MPTFLKLCVPERRVNAGFLQGIFREFLTPFTLKNPIFEYKIGRGSEATEHYKKEAENPHFTFISAW